MNKYEGLFIFEGSRSDDELEQTVERVCNEIVRAGGEIKTRRALGRRSFARPMGKKDSGMYARIGFMLEPAKVDALLARYKLSGDVFRLQVTRVEEFLTEAEVKAPESAGQDRE